MINYLLDILNSMCLRDNKGKYYPVLQRGQSAMTFYMRWDNEPTDFHMLVEVINLAEVSKLEDVMKRSERQDKDQRFRVLFTVWDCMRREILSSTQFRPRQDSVTTDRFSRKKHINLNFTWPGGPQKEIKIQRSDKI